jgi:ABC-type phosphate/phosphonate transport system substrate-binding protein
MPMSLGVAVALVLGAALAACSSAANSDGQLACQHVETSLRLYAQANAAALSGQAALAAQRRSSALEQLRIALPLASNAASSDGEWQPLMATLSESNRVAEVYLVDALTQQCSSNGLPG